MKLTLEIAGEKHALDLNRESERVVAEIDGRRYELEAREMETGVYLLHVDGRVYECRVDSVKAPRGEADVHVSNRLYHITLIDPKRLRSAQSTGAEAIGSVAVRASMPGKVVRRLVEAGAHVEAGDGLLVIEAMKMQNEIKSPKAGTVVELHAQAGATVSAGDVLVIVE